MRFDQVHDPATQVILHPDREMYSMTESIRPRLEIRNRSDSSVEIVGGFAFDWERLAFCTPNAVHLMAPDGRDLVRPYHREAPFLASEYPIRLGPGSSHWRYLPVSNFLHLRQVGEYELWLELLDSTGELHRTDHVTFRVTDVEPSVPPGTIELSLGSSRSVYSSAEPTVVTPIFTNYGERRLVLAGTAGGLDLRVGQLPDLPNSPCSTGTAAVLALGAPQRQYRRPGSTTRTDQNPAPRPAAPRRWTWSCPTSLRCGSPARIGSGSPTSSGARISARAETCLTGRWAGMKRCFVAASSPTSWRSL